MISAWLMNGSGCWSRSSARLLLDSGSWSVRPIHGRYDSMDDPTLFWMLIGTLVLSVLLLFASGMTLGRKVADLEYQLAKDINGIRRIQSWVNIRTHANRVFLALAFLIVALLSLLIDVQSFWRVWIDRVLLILVLVNYTVSSVLDWLDDRRLMALDLAEHAKGSPDV
jgi:hypothetical protein